MAEEIDVVIDTKGNVQVHVKGVKGKKCTEITEELSKVLGGSPINQKLTPEYHQTEQRATVKAGR